MSTDILLSQIPKYMFPEYSSEFTYTRTYSRWREDLGRRETWEETVQRYIDFIKEERGNLIPPKVLKKMKQYILGMDVMPSMRALWAAGEAAKRDNTCMYNCSTQVIDSPEAFAECLYILMCGTGYGFSVQNVYVNSETMPVVPTLTSEGIGTVVIEDNKSGWADSLKVLFNALYQGKDVDFDYSKIRKKGEKLKTMGGRASGSGPLIKLHNFIRETFSKAQGRKLTSLECHDICNEIAEIVVVGGVRRSSQISISDLNDESMRNAKVFPFPPRRYMANNSAAYLEKPSAVDFLKEWSSLASSGSGERGIFNLVSARNNSPKRRDASKIVSTNPCVTGDTEILTRDGYTRIDSLVDQEVEVWNGFEWSKVTPKITGTNQDLVTVTLSDGRTLTCTEYHKFHIAQGYTGKSEVVNAVDLQQGMKLIKHEFPIIEHGPELEDAYTQGFVAAEGMELSRTLQVYKPKEMCLKRLQNVKSSKWEERNQRYNLTLSKTPVSKNFVPVQYNLKSKIEWLSGLFDGDGTELKEGGLQLVSVNRQFLIDLQKLLSTIGIQAKVLFANKAGYRSMPNHRDGNSDYFCQESYRICIGAVQMQQLKKLGLKCERMSFNKEPQRDASQFITVVDVTSAGTAEIVYCFNEPKRHLGIFNGVLTGQCGEILLRSKQFCNLSEVVVRPEDDLDDLLEKVECATWIGTIQSTFTHFPYLSKEWKENCDEERLLGVSLTGQMDNPELMTEDTFKALKNRAIKVAKKASGILGINMPAAITCVKPSGCRPYDALVTTKEGIFTLEDLITKHHLTTTNQWSNVNDYNTYGAGKITKTYINGVASVFKVNLSFGMELESTANHQWYVKNRGFTRTDEIKSGDIIEIEPNIYDNEDSSKLITLNCDAIKTRSDATEILQPTNMTPDLAWLLGYLWGDGAMSPNKFRIRFTDQNTNNLLKASRIIKEIFGIDSKLHNASEGRDAKVLEIGSKHLWHWLIKNDVWKYYKEDIDIIPLVVRTSSKKDIIAFISGVIDADGCYNDKNKTVTLASASSKFSSHLQHIAWSVGLCFGRSKNTKGQNLQKDKCIYLMSLSCYSNNESLNILKEFSTKLSNKNLRAENKDNLHKIGYTIGEVSSVEYIGEMPTFDVETDEHWFYAGSVKSHNTVSQLVNSASGLHVRYSPYYIRRYRISATDPLFKLLKAQNVPLTPENGQENLPENEVSTWVLSFVVKSPENAVTRHDVSALDQLEYYKKVQKNWCEHNASCTIYVRDDEWFLVGNWVYENWDFVGGLSFLPYDGGIYKLAPYEEITKEQYEELVTKQVVIDYSKLSEFEKEDNTEGSQTFSCVGDKCELK